MSVYCVCVSVCVYVTDNCHVYPNTYNCNARIIYMYIMYNI